MFQNTLKIIGKIKNDVKIKPVKQDEGSNSDEQVEEKVFVTVNTRINNINQTKSLVYVELTKKLWSEIEDVYDKKSVVIIGEAQARITKNNKPFIYMIAREVHLTVTYNKEQRRIQSYKKHIENTISQRSEKTKSKKRVVHWLNNFKEEDFQEMDISKIFIKEEEHMKGFVNFHTKTNSNKYAKSYPLVVRPEENGMYSLVVGFSSYATHKISNSNPMVYITELTVPEFKEKYLKVVDDDYDYPDNIVEN